MTGFIGHRCVDPSSTNLRSIANRVGPAFVPTGSGIFARIVIPLRSGTVGKRALSLSHPVGALAVEAKLSRLGAGRSSRSDNIIQLSGGLSKLRGHTDTGGRGT
jgi:hypothetical protein